MTAHVSMLLKSRASPDMLTFTLCNKKKKKTCNSAHEQTPLSKDTIDSVLRHREVVGAKDLSAPPRINPVYFHSVCEIQPPFPSFRRINSVHTLPYFVTNKLVTSYVPIFRHVSSIPTSNFLNIFVMYAMCTICIGYLNDLIPQYTKHFILLSF